MYSIRRRPQLVSKSKDVVHGLAGTDSAFEDVECTILALLNVQLVLLAEIKRDRFLPRQGFQADFLYCQVAL